MVVVCVSSLLLIFRNLGVPFWMIWVPPKLENTWNFHYIVGDIFNVILFRGLEHGFYDFPFIGKFIIPTDELHHFSEG